MLAVILKLDLKKKNLYIYLKKLKHVSDCETSAYHDCYYCHHPNHHRHVPDYKMSAEKFPQMTGWVQRMWQDPVVLECKIDPKLFVDHYSKYRTGKPDFTIGASKAEPVKEPLENLDGLRDPSTRDRQVKN